MLLLRLFDVAPDSPWIAVYGGVTLLALTAWMARRMDR